MKKIKIIFFVVIFVSIIFSIVYLSFFYKKNVDSVKENKRIEVTEEERISNFEYINNYYKENPVSTKEREKALKEMDKNISKDKPLTDEERAIIINSFKK